MARLPIYDTAHLERDSDGVWGGVVYILNVPHHVVAIRVENDADGFPQPWVPEGRSEPLPVTVRRFQRIIDLYTPGPVTVRLPDMPGKYVLLIHPCEDSGPPSSEYPQS